MKTTAISQDKEFITFAGLVAWHYALRQLPRRSVHQSSDELLELLVQLDHDPVRELI